MFDNFDIVALIAGLDINGNDLFGREAELLGAVAFVSSQLI